MIHIKEFFPIGPGFLDGIGLFLRLHTHQMVFR